MALTSLIRGSLAVIGVVLVFAPWSDTVTRFAVGPVFIAFAALFPSLASLAFGQSRSHCGTFCWTKPLPNDDDIGSPPAAHFSDDFGEQWQYQVTEPVARSVHESARVCQSVTVGRGPTPDDHGWFVELKIRGWTCDLFLQWVADDDYDNRFAFSGSYRHRAVRYILRRNEYDQRMLALGETIASVLESSDGITAVVFDRHAQES